jgi:HEAT repeat protein
VRAVAARSLGRLRCAEATEELIEAFGRRLIPRGIVSQALLRIGPPGVAGLSQALSATDPGTRSLAADVLGRIGALSVAPQLAKLAEDDPALSARVSAVEALGRFGLREWTGPILQAAGRQQPEQLREAAVEALGSIGTEEASSALGLLMGDPDLRVGARAAARLAEVGPFGRAALDQASSSTPTGEQATRAAAQARAALALLSLGRRAS